MWSDALDARTVSVELYQVPLIQVLEYVARRLDADLTGGQGLYYIGTAEPRDRATGVFRVGRLDGAQAQELLQGVITDSGAVVAYDDGMVVVTESVAVLSRVGSLLQQVDAVQSPVWCVQYMLVESIKRGAVDVGIDSAVSVDVAAAFAESVVTTVSKGEARASFVADVNNQAVSVYAAPLFVLADGEEGNLKRVEIVPVPQYTTIETGAVVTSGYTDVEIGLTVLAKVREVGEASAFLDYDLKLGELVGYVDDTVPIRTEESLQGRTVVVSGGTYLLGALERSRASDAVLGPLQLRRTRQSEHGRLEVWALVTRVSPG